MVDTSDEWIVSRTGIRERRVAAAHETTASMGAVAGPAGDPHRGPQARRHRRDHPRDPVARLLDSAGARITDQVELFPGRRGAGRIFANQVRLSGKVPQVCCLFGPSAAGGAYIPAFCDVVFMVEGNASMYLGSPRMAEMVIGEKVTLEEMGGARMHATVSAAAATTSCATDEDAIDAARRFLSYLPTIVARAAAGREPARAGRRRTPIARHRARRGAARVRHAQGDRRARRRRTRSSSSSRCGRRS